MITIFEFTKLVSEKDIDSIDPDKAIKVRAVPPAVFNFLWASAESISTHTGAKWITLDTYKKQPAVYVQKFAGIVRTDAGAHIEVLPKTGKVGHGTDASDAAITAARTLLVEMVCCLQNFPSIHAGAAQLAARHMPLLDVFIAQFLQTVNHVVKRGLRSHYEARQDNLFALRGKLLVSQHIKHNLVRADRFFTEHDEFNVTRPENRLIRLALEWVLNAASTHDNQRLCRELLFAFADVPASQVPAQDFQRVRLDRGMGHYTEAMEWVKWVLEHLSPVPTRGERNAPALLFPMDALFEAYVAKHLRKKVEAANPYRLRAQAQSKFLVTHQPSGRPMERWFQLKPDLLIANTQKEVLCVLDTKWKLIDGAKGTTEHHYGLSQGDLYQLQSHGLRYLTGDYRDVVLIYPQTAQFHTPLNPFYFESDKVSDGGRLTLWVLPFCFETKALILPAANDDTEGSKRLRHFFERAVSV